MELYGMSFYWIMACNIKLLHSNNCFNKKASLEKLFEEILKQNWINSF